MSQEQKNPINLSVHEIADPSDITPNTDGQAASDRRESHNVDHDEENFDTLNPNPANTDEEKLGSQTTIANISAG